MTYPLAGDGVFRTVQGEGFLAGVPMVFVRLAGCSVGCAECDTDYRVRERSTADEIHERALFVIGNCGWVWITGGEPADHPLGELVKAMRTLGKVGLATSGRKPIGLGDRCDFVSVSPHGKPDDLYVCQGHQINLVPGLNGLKLADWNDFSFHGFKHRYVTPCEGKPDTLSECLEWMSQRTSWKLGVQQQKLWGIA
jgi:7-carboxy-7-deazaguanine synthase